MSSHPPEGSPAQVDEAAELTRRTRTAPALAGRALRTRLAPPFLAALAIRILIGLTEDVPGVDATAFLESGRNLWSGDGLTFHGRPQVHFPPLLPFLLGGLAKLVGGEENAAVIFGVLASTGIVVLLGFLAHRLTRRLDVAVTTAWVAALAPGLSHQLVRGDGGSAAPFTCLLLGAALCVLAARDAEGRRVLTLLGGAGACLGLAYLTRPEALIVAALMVAAVAVPAVGGWRALRKRSFRPAQLRRACVLSVALLVPLGSCIAPYVVWLHGATGSWQLSAKTQDASIDAWKAVAEADRHTRDIYLYGLDETGTHFAAGESESLVSLALGHPKTYAHIVLINLEKIFEIYVETSFSLSFPFVSFKLVAVLATAVALVQLFRRRSEPGVGVVGAVAVGSLVTCVLFFTLPRYLTPTTAVICLFAGWGLADLRSAARDARAARRTKSSAVSSATGPVAIAVERRTRRTWTWVWPVTVVASVASLYSGLEGPGGFMDPSEPVEAEIAAEWIEANGGPDDIVMTRSFIVQYYLERDVLALPYADYDATLEFARYYGARWLVADESYLRTYRPELYTLLLEDPYWPPGLRLAYEFTYQGRLTRIFEIFPTSEEPTEPPIPLGWVGDM